MLESRLPYPGLRAFERDEADLFFGRDGVVDDMIDKLAITRFLCVLGASGTGKSSLVKTGLLDSLELGLHPAGSQWQICLLTPGGAPFHNLAEVLLQLNQNDEATETTSELSREEQINLLAGYLREGPRSIIDWFRDNSPSSEHNLLILVDQFEELFRFSDYEGKETAEAFAKMLIASSESLDSSIHIVITMRAEFLGSCALIPGLAETINKGTFLTPRMSRSACLEAIIGPARLVGAEIEKPLLTRILNDMTSLASWDKEDIIDRRAATARRADQLPLMQHLLNRLWSERKNKTDNGQKLRITLMDYERHGGLEGALDAHGEQLLSTFSDEELKVVEAVFRCLVEGDSADSAVRRPRRLSELVEETGADEVSLCRIIDTFRSDDCNFLRPGQSHAITGRTVIDLSHESLIRQWSKLSGWVEAEARAANFWGRLSSANSRYRRGEGDILTGLDLATLHQWWSEAQTLRTWSRRYSQDFEKVENFLNLSVKTHEAKKIEAENQARLNRRRLLSALATVSVLALIASFAAIWGYKQTEAANNVSQVASTAADDLALGLFNRLDEGLRIPLKTRYALIEDREEAFERMAKISKSDSLFLEKRIELLIRSADSLLSGGWVDQAAERAKILEELIFSEKAKKTSASHRLQTLKILAEVARQQSRLKAGLSYIMRADDLIGQINFSRIEMLQEKMWISYHRYSIANDMGKRHLQSTALDTAKELKQQVIEIFPDLEAHETKVEGIFTSDEQHAIAEIIGRELLLRARAGSGLLKSTGAFDKEGAAMAYLQSLEKSHDIFLNASSGAKKHELLNGYILYTISKFIGDVLRDEERAYTKADEAVDYLENLFAEDSSSFSKNRALLTLLWNRSWYAARTSREDQARSDKNDASALNFWWSVNQKTAVVKQLQSTILLDSLNYEIERVSNKSSDSLKLYSNSFWSNYKHLDAYTDEYSLKSQYKYGLWMKLDPKVIADETTENLQATIDEMLAGCDPEIGDEQAQFRCLELRYWTFARIAKLDKKRVGKEKWLSLLRSGLRDADRMLNLRPNSIDALSQRQFLSAILANSRLIDRAEAIALHSVSIDLAGQLMDFRSARTQYVQNGAASSRDALNMIDASHKDTRELLSYVKPFIAKIVNMQNAPGVTNANISYLSSLQRAAKNAKSRLRKSSNSFEEEVTELNNILSTMSKLIELVDPDSKRLINNLDTVKLTVRDWKHLKVDLEAIGRGDDTALNWTFVPALKGSWRTLASNNAFFEKHPTVLDVVGGHNAVFAVRELELPFYNNGSLVEIETRASGEPLLFSYLVFPDQLYPLNGTSPVIHQANKQFGINLNSANTVSAYLQFFCLFVNGDEGAFQIIESVDDMQWQWFQGETFKQFDEIKPLIRPLVVWPSPDKADHWLATASVHYSNRVFHAEFEIQPTGIIQMLSDIPLATNLPVKPFKIKELRSGTQNSKPPKSVNVERFGIPRLVSTRQHVKYITDELARGNTDINLSLIERYVRLLVLEHNRPRPLPTLISQSNAFAYELFQNKIAIEKGIDLATSVLKVEPENFYYMDTLAYGYLISGEIEKGLNILENASNYISQAVPDAKAEYYAHLGYALILKGELKSAEDYFKKARSLAKTDETKVHIANLWAESKLPL